MEYQDIILTSLEFDVLLAVKYLVDDRRTVEKLHLQTIGSFLRGSTRSSRKSYMKKYDLYGKYAKLNNDEIENILIKCNQLKLVAIDHGYQITPKGKAYILHFNPNADDNPYVSKDIQKPDRYPGEYATYACAKSFVKMYLNTWLDKMETGYQKISPHLLKNTEETAWKDCFHVLKDTFKLLPKKFENLYLIFEYVLPQHKPGTKHSENDVGIRADVILLSAETVIILEFKQREDDYEGFIAQANKYATRIKRFHEQSIGMKVQPILVLTKAQNYYQKHDKVVTCSADRLAETIISVCEDNIQKHPDIKAWIHSRFIEIEK